MCRGFDLSSDAPTIARGCRTRKSAAARLCEDSTFGTAEGIWRVTKYGRSAETSLDMVHTPQ